MTLLMFVFRRWRKSVFNPSKLPSSSSSEDGFVSSFISMLSFRWNCKCSQRHLRQTMSQVTEQLRWRPIASTVDHQKVSSTNGHIRMSSFYSHFHLTNSKMLLNTCQIQDQVSSVEDMLWSMFCSTGTCVDGVRYHHCLSNFAPSIT